MGNALKPEPLINLQVAAVIPGVPESEAERLMLLLSKAFRENVERYLPSDPAANTAILFRKAPPK